MQVSELANIIGATYAQPCEDGKIRAGYACDLLSWVMAKGIPGCAWITVQTHMNVIAVAALHEMACIIHPEGVEPEAASLEKAAQEGIAVLLSPKTAYEICHLMAAAGIPTV